MMARFNKCLGIVTLVILGAAIDSVSGHGYILNPPGRSTAWRVGFGTPENFDDNALNCGGVGVQYDNNGGRCGVCGDSDSDNSRPNEPGEGNMYATGTIVATYVQGQYIAVEALVTAFHMGYFQFKLCTNNQPQSGFDRSVAVTQECLDVNVLKDESENTRIVAHTGLNTMTIKLPDFVSCDFCVLQWKYRAGNNWGSELIDNVWHSGMGFGPQEEFVNCADIKIISSGSSTPDVSTMFTTTPSSTTAPSITTPTATTPSTTTPTITPSTITPFSTTLFSTNSPTTGSPSNDECYGLLDSLDVWCQNNCPTGTCPTDHCWCIGNPFPTTKECQATSPSSSDSWCDSNCNNNPPFCPSGFCTCSEVPYDPRLPGAP